MIRRLLLLVLLTLSGVFTGDASASASASALMNVLPNVLPSYQPPAKESLLCGWFPLDPYQYTTISDGIESLTGMDVQMIRAIAKDAGKKIIYERISWRQHLMDLREGKRDVAVAATYTPERATYVYYSNPYRDEENSLFVPRGSENVLKFNNIAEMLADIKRKKFRLGIVDAYIYADPLINEWILDPSNQSLLVRVGDDTGNLDNLLQGKIDGFLADRVVGATVIWRAGKGQFVNERRLYIKTPLHYIFSKKSVPYSVVEEFNKAIVDVKKTDEYNLIVSWYLQPILLLQTIDTDWFRIIEYIGTIAFAISGLVIACRDDATIFGAFVLAVLPSLGGGILRDLLFARKPIGILQSPSNLLLVIGTVLSGYFLLKLFKMFLEKNNENHSLPFVVAANKPVAEYVLVICDGLGLATFTVTGIVVSVMAKASPLWLWGPFFAFLTGAGGGILRDMISKDRSIVSLRGDIYPEIALIWGMFLSIFLIYQSNTIDPDAIRYAVIITVVGAFIMRILIYVFKVPNLYFMGKLSP